MYLYLFSLYTLTSSASVQMRVYVTISNDYVLKFLSYKPIVHTYPVFRRQGVK